MNEEAKQWLESGGNRNIEEIREKIPCGDSLTTIWRENGVICRQDVEIMVSKEAISSETKLGQVV